jgi:hypothetical protein
MIVRGIPTNDTAPPSSELHTDNASITLISTDFEHLNECLIHLCFCRSRKFNIFRQVKRDVTER